MATAAAACMVQSPGHTLPKSGTFVLGVSHPLFVQFDGITLCNSVLLAKPGVDLKPPSTQLHLLGQMLWDQLTNAI